MLHSIFYKIGIKDLIIEIPFVSKVKNMDKMDGPEVNKIEWIKLEFLVSQQA
jgi:hypothetical protein